MLFIFASCRSDSSRHAEDLPRANSNSVYLLIDYAADRADTLTMNISPADTVTVLDILTAIAQREDIILETKKFVMGTMVEQIGDRRNGEGGYWIYTINSEAIPASASAHTVNRGDTIRFIFR